MNTNDKVKALAVLGLIGTVIQDCQYTNNAAIKKQADKIRRWHIECVDEINGPTISGKVQRQLTTYSKRVFSARVDHFQSDGVTEKTIVHESIAADGMVNWLVTKHALKGRNWRYLLQTFNTLVECFVGMFPEHEDWALYEKLDDIVRV
jgi:hypothetical protein